VDSIRAQCGTHLLRTLTMSNFLMKIAGLACHVKEISPYRSVALPRLALALALAGGIGHAQPRCPPLNFQGAPSASLKPTASTHIVVLQQSDGSYTAFELTDASPYRIVRTSPNFQRQFTGCPGFPVAGIYPLIQPPELFTRLNSGGYLWVRRSGVNAPGDLYVAAFDSALNLTSEARYPVAAGALAVVDVNGDGFPDILLGVPGRSAPACRF
jgi:FG-GAP repeat